MTNKRMKNSYSFEYRRQGAGSGVENILLLGNNFFSIVTCRRAMNFLAT